MHDVTKYANDVLEGKIIAGKSVIKACQRHINDLKKQGTEVFPFIFVPEKADRIINFAKTLKLAEGDQGIRNLNPAPFQRFILGSLFGWVHKDTGYRRFRQSYVQVSRQQGKSLLNGVLGTYCSNFDGYQYPQVYIAAPKLKQSKIVYKEIMKFIQSDEDLAELFKVKEYKSTIECLVSKGEIVALSRDSKFDGIRPYLAILDEYHQHPTNDIYNALIYGQRTLGQCLTSIITTAGNDFNSPCFPMYEYCLKVLENPEENEQLFIYIAQMDEEDDIWNPDNWIKCMPLIDEIPSMKESIMVDAHKAKSLGGKDLNEFMTKVFNIWCVSGDTQFINVKKWKDSACDLTLEDMRGKECFVGIDLSGGGRGDLCSLAFEFPLEENKFFVHSISFMAKAHLDSHIKTDDVPYNKWVDEGLIILTNGYKTDFQRILQYLRDVQEEYDIKYRAICYDPHNINGIINDLDTFGCDVVEIKQSARSLNDATLDFRLTVEEKGILYNRNNELLTWSILNAKLVYNSFGECKIEKDKGKRTKRIDPVDAVIDAHKLAMIQRKKEKTVIDADYLAEYGW
ncbi:terminase large subunit [Brevibacillus thermoruber]|uniref:terminase large subunit n=1 Tax=Brevibacillus thermoruber TaxID=33942 RepID=UPI0040422375